MGFLDAYDVDLNEFNESGFDDPDDGTYAFEVIKGETKEGTKRDDDAVHIVIYFNLENEDGEVQSWNWWLKVPDDPSRASRRESISMSDWKKWLLAAGFDASEIGSVGPEDIEGLTGTVRLVTGRPNKDGNAYQNPRDWTFDGVAEDEEEAPPAKKEPAKKSTAKRAKPAPEPEPEYEEEEEAEEAPASKTRTRAKSNPFKTK